MIGFFAKKIISQGLVPFNLGLAGSVFGCFFIFKRNYTVGSYCVLGAIALIYIFSTPIVANHLLKRLETQYPEIQFDDLPDARFIVVLGGGLSRTFQPKDQFKLSSASLQRLTQAVELYEAQKQKGKPATLILSGGNAYNPEHPEANYFAIEAIQLGVDPQDIIIENQSLDTADQAIKIFKLISHQPTYLVTSASHMPRSMALFQHQGMKPIAVPCNFLATRFRWWANWLPQSNMLGYSQAALHEYFGLLWSKWCGSI